MVHYEAIGESAWESQVAGKRPTTEGHQFEVWVTKLLGGAAIFDEWMCGRSLRDHGRRGGVTGTSRPESSLCAPVLIIFSQVTVRQKMLCPDVGCV